MGGWGGSCDRYSRSPVATAAQFSAALAALMVGGILLAEEAAPEHGKLSAADATPVAPGDVELEFGFSHSRATRAWNASGESSARPACEESAAGFSLTAGAVENLDLNLSLDYLWLGDDGSDPDRGDSIGDLSIGCRWRFVASDGLKMDAAYITALTVPTGSRNDPNQLCTSQEFWSWENALAVSKDWGRWTANAELGFLLPFGERRKDARGALAVNVAAGYQATAWMQPEAELNWSREFLGDDVEVGSLAVTAGLVMPVSDRLRVNVGVQQAVWGENADRTTTIMLFVKTAF